MTPFRFSFALLLAIAGVTRLAADPLTLASAPVGMRDTVLTAQSDTIVAPAYTRPPVYVGTVGSIASGAIVVSGSPNWTVARFAYAAGTTPDHHYVRLGAGPSGTPNPREGRVFEIVTNDTGTLYPDTGGEDISDVPAGTAVTVVPHWTLGTLFPAADAGVSFVASPSALARKTLLLLPDYTGTGINLSASAIYYFYNGYWRRSGASVSENHGDDVIPCNTGFTVRNTGDSDLRLRVTGTVVTDGTATLLSANANMAQDTPLSTGRPVPVALSDLGLISSGAFTPSLSALNRKDLLLVFDGAAPGFNPSATSIYYHYNGSWRKSGQSVAQSYDATTVAPDVMFIVRKAAASTSSEWINTPVYRLATP